MNNFNFIAPFYDRLARLVFGSSIEDATNFYLGEIKENSDVLFLGGGTGRVLLAMPVCKSITYLEKSGRMILRAKTKKVDARIEFVEDDFLKFHSQRSYDIVICPFFLDCFNDEHLANAIGQINTLVKKDGKLLVTDFQSTNGNWLIRFMHLFFRAFASLESKKLKNIHHFILQNRFETEKEEFFHKNMIFSRVYRNL